MSTLGAPRAACGKFMLRLATYKKEKKKQKKRATQKKPQKKSDAKRLKEKGPEKPKRKKARRVLLTKNKSYKKRI